jgi:signal transduction histidine kinase
VKLNPEDKRTNGLLKNQFIGENSTDIEETYKILNISANDKIHDAVLEKLKYFSFNGRQITILKALSMQEARSVAESNPDIVLVVIDSNVQLNGSYQALINYVRVDLANELCHFAFKDGMNTDSIQAGLEMAKSSNQPEFEFARDRLLDIIRMIMIATDMECRTEGNRLLEHISDGAFSIHNDNTKLSDNITREKLYTILAHDIKEPIGNIKVILDFLTNEPDLLDMRTSQELLNSVKESASSIHDLLDNFLFWTRMHKHEIYFNPVRVNIAHIVRENITLLKGIAANKNISISREVEENHMVIADEYMMTTVVRNLLYNAIKFTSRGGGILVTANEKGGFVEISVQDTGIGLKKADLDNLFEPDVYNKTRGTSRETGMGLGLILCKDFIEKNGGRIKVESDEGFGSTFTFTLPKWNTISVN